MTPADDNGPDFGSDDAVAAEYVLGVLPAQERQAAARRIDTDLAFARLVDAWDVRLSPLADGYAPVEAPVSVRTVLEQRLFAPQPATQAVREPLPESGFWASLAFWRGLAAAAVAALAIYIAIPFIAPPVETPQMRLVASLAPQGSDVQYLVIYDAAKGDVALSHVSGARAEGSDFELWMIEGGNAPVSMGVIPVGSAIHVTVAAAARDKLAQGAVLAVSLEPLGGSPTGQPTGPVVAAGDLKSI